MTILYVRRVFNYLSTYHHTAFPMSPTSQSLISLVGNLMLYAYLLESKRVITGAEAVELLHLQVWASFLARFL